MPNASPVIIEAALNGITSRGHNPRVPIQPDELATDAIACIDAGATVVHTHAHNLGSPAAELTAAYADCYGAVLAERPGTILYPTTGAGTSVAERYAHIVALASEGLIRASFVDPGSVNLGGAGPDGLPPPLEYVYKNSFADIRYAFDLSVQHALAPSIAVFEPGFLQVVLAYHEAGALPRARWSSSTSRPAATSRAVVRSGAFRRSPRASISTSRCSRAPTSRGRSR